MSTKPVPQNKSNSEYQKVSITKALKISKWAFELIYQIQPVHTIVFVLTNLITAQSNIVYTYIFARALDELMTVIQTPDANIQMLYRYLLIMFGYSTFETILYFFRDYSRGALRTFRRTNLRNAMCEKLASLGIQTLEDPEVNNNIHRANERLPGILQYLQQSIGLFSYIIKLIISGIIVYEIMPSYIPIVLVIAIPYFAFDKKIRKTIYMHIFDNTENNRMAFSWSRYLTEKENLKEIFITQAYDYLSKKFLKFRKWFDNEFFRIQKKWNFIGSIFGFLWDVILYFGYLQIFKQFLGKLISIGQVAFWMRSIQMFQDTLKTTIRTFNDLSEFSLDFKDAYALFNTESGVEDGKIALPTMEKGPSIEIENVSFVYPKGKNKILKNINLDIKPGEKIAIVGHNGAGKTTLIKLICRFYKTTEGNIIIDDKNINDLKIDSLYKNMGVLFQEYNTYPSLTAKENIYIGDTRKRINETAIRSAAKTADAIGFIKKFDKGFDQILSERYKEGIRPSTGQWQKIAIARFFYRNAPLVIFDEPTAAIDAVSEYNIFNNIYKFFENKTVIIISHRFSTVRNADRIIVLDDGKIIEDGTHEELLQLNGKYAEGFRLQAEGYQN